MAEKPIWQRGDSIDKYPGRVPGAAKHISKVAIENGTPTFYIDFCDDETEEPETKEGKTIKRMC